MSRTELVLLLVLAFLVLLGLTWLGWRGRAKRQSALPPLPPAPPVPGTDLLEPLTGLYVGTTISTEWQNRIVVHTLGQRADAELRLSEAGVVIERQGAGAIHIPAEALVDARLEPALAGKVVGRGGLLVLRWQHGEVLLDTGLRADDKSRYPDWVRAIAALNAAGAAALPGDDQPAAPQARADSHNGHPIDSPTDGPTEEAGSTN